MIKSVAYGRNIKDNHTFHTKILRYLDKCFVNDILILNRMFRPAICYMFNTLMRRVAWKMGKERDAKAGSVLPDTM